MDIVMEVFILLLQNSLYDVKDRMLEDSQNGVLYLLLTGCWMYLIRIDRKLTSLTANSPQQKEGESPSGSV